MLVSASAVIGCWLNAPIGGVLFIFEITSNEDIWDKSFWQNVNLEDLD